MHVGSPFFIMPGGKYFFLIFIRPKNISTFDSNHTENSSLAYQNHPLT